MLIKVINFDLQDDEIYMYLIYTVDYLEVLVVADQDSKPLCCNFSINTTIQLNYVVPVHKFSESDSHVVCFTLELKGETLL